jgi:hypothetical protein
LKPRYTSGRESWIFRAERAEQLCGHHAELMNDALAPGEGLRYLLYSPLRETNAGFFGVDATSGSHALAVTDRRFVLSRDPHDDAKPRSVSAVPFEAVLSVEIGQALTLGWFVLCFAQDGSVAMETAAFHSSGIGHFQAAVRAFRSRSVASPPDRYHRRAGKVLAKVPAYLWHELKPLLLPGEPPRMVLASRETWAPLGRSGARQRCISPWLVCVVSEGAVLLVENERPRRRGALAFAMHVTCLDRRAVTRAHVVQDESGFEGLLFEAEAQGVRRALRFPLDGNCHEDAAVVVRALNCRETS